MWSLLLSVFADGATARAQKAATHELRQRLGVAAVVDRRPPPFTRQLLDWERVAHSVDLGNGFSLIETLYGIAEEIASNVGGSRGLVRPGLLEQTLEILGPGEPVLEGQAAYDRALVRRTPVDGVLAWVLDQWKKGGLDYHFNYEVALHLRNIQDWAEATGRDFTRMSWEDAVAAADAWHVQFKVADFGEVPRPALVVLRWPDGWTLQRLLERPEFADEGSTMGHCIGGPIRENGRPNGDGSYWKQTRDDDGAAFSLRDPQGIPYATISVIATDYRTFLIEDVEAANNTPLLTDVRLRLLSAYPALGMYADRRSFSGLAMQRSGVANALRPPDPGEPDPEVDAVYTGRPWLSLGAKAIQEATTETEREAGRSLMLDAVRSFASAVGEPERSVWMRKNKDGRMYVGIHPNQSPPATGSLRVRPRDGEPGVLIEAVFPYSEEDVVEYPTLYAAYVAVSGRPKVQPYTGVLYPDVTEAQRKAMTEAVDIAGGAARGMGRRSDLLVALGRAEPKPTLSLGTGNGEILAEWVDFG